MKILTSGKGAVHATQGTIFGVNHWNADMRNNINILTSYHQLYLYQVRAFSGWFMGDETSSLIKSSDMKINAINSNEARNLGLVNRYKIRLWQLSGALHFRRNKKGVQNGMYMPQPTTTKSGLPAGTNTIRSVKRSSRLRKSVNMKPILPILLINQLNGTFP